MMNRPTPSIAFAKDVALYNEPPLVCSISGELKVSRKNHVLGAAHFAGRVRNVWMSVGNCGTDVTNALNISGEVYINGVSCMTTTPKIAGVSGEAGAQKTTLVLGDTMIVQGVVNPAANSFSRGDVFTCNIKLQRTATPADEIESIVLVVDLLPDTPVSP